MARVLRTSRRGRETIPSSDGPLRRRKDEDDERDEEEEEAEDGVLGDASALRTGDAAEGKTGRRREPVLLAGLAGAKAERGDDRQGRQRHLVGLRAGVLKFGRSFTITGTVQPTFPGRQTKVAIQRKAGAKWANVKTVAATIDPKTGACNCADRPLKRGSWRVKASVPAMKSYKAAATSWTTFVVR